MAGTGNHTVGAVRAHHVPKRKNIRETLYGNQESKKLGSFLEHTADFIGQQVALDRNAQADHVGLSVDFGDDASHPRDRHADPQQRRVPHPRQQRLLQTHQSRE